MKTTTWYKTSFYFCISDPHTAIKEVQVTRHTDKSVWVIEQGPWNHKQEAQCKRRNGDTEKYFPTREEAVAYVTKIYDQSVDTADRSLKRAKENVLMSIKRKIDWHEYVKTLEDKD